MSEAVQRKIRSHMKRLKMPFRRRREGKTDYRQRHTLIRHSKQNYGEVKSRLVVRVTGSKVICQIVKAYIGGDKVVCSAESTELKKYGITFGLKNYSAAYATGFLCARKLLTRLNLGAAYTGKDELDGGEYLEEDNEEGPAAYRCYLDIGLARSSKGAKVFSAMKGACDGGLYVPHSVSKLAGFNDGELDSEVLKDYIYGGHVAKYMRHLQEEDEERYKAQFSQYISQGVTPETIEERYSKAFEMIRNDSFAEKKERVEQREAKEKLRKLTAQEKRERAQKKFSALTEGEGEAMELEA